MSSLRNDSPPQRRLPRVADEALRRARLNVVPDRIEEARRAPFIALVAVVLAAGVAGLLTFNTSMQQASFRATALEQQATALTARKQSLAMQLAADRDPQQLAARAKQLGMVPPPDPAFIQLSDGRILGTPTAATTDDSMRINPLPAGKPEVLAPKPKIVRVPAPTVADPTATTALPTAQTDLPVESTTSGQRSTVEKSSHRAKAQGTQQ